MNLAIARRPSVSEKVVHQPDGPESGVLRRATNVRQTPLGSNGAPGKTWDLQVELMLAGWNERAPKGSSSTSRLFAPSRCTQRRRQRGSARGLNPVVTYANQPPPVLRSGGTRASRY